MNKLLLYISISITPFVCSYAQHLEVSNHLEYALVKNGELYLTEKLANTDLVHMKIYQTAKRSKYPKHVPIQSNFWKISNNIVCINGKEFYNIEIPTVDSLVGISRRRIFLDSVRRSLNDDKLYLEFKFKELDVKAKKLNIKTIIPLYELVKMYDQINFNYRKKLKNKLSLDDSSVDLIISNNETVEFIYRNDRLLSVWSYEYPLIGEPDKPEFWNEQFTLTYDTSIVCENKFLYKLPLYKKVVYNSITDSSFFEGNLKFIQQAGIYFAINQKNGNIYFVAENGVHNIGQIQLETYSRRIKGERLFIEDLDNERLIIFSTYTKSETEHPFPNILSIIDDKAYKEYFPGLMRE